MGAAAILEGIARNHVYVTITADSQLSMRLRMRMQKVCSLVRRKVETRCLFEGGIIIFPQIGDAMSHEYML